MAGAVRQVAGLSRSLAGMAGCLAPGRPTAPNPVPIQPYRAVHAGIATAVDHCAFASIAAGPCRRPGGLQQVASEGMLQSAKSVAGPSSLQQQQQRQTDVCDGEVLGPDGWPAAHALTTVSRLYSYRTVVLNWRDPRIPGMLRPVIQARASLGTSPGFGMMGDGDQSCRAWGTHNACCSCEL